MPTNALLVRTSDGWREVTYPDSMTQFGRREALLDLGSIQEGVEVDRVAGLQLEAFGIVRTKIAVDHDPLSVADRPYRSYNVADQIDVPPYPGEAADLQRVRTITASEDENGEVTYAPEVGDVVLEEQERITQAIAKMLAGTLDGESVVAQPTRTVRIPIVPTPVKHPTGWNMGSGNGTENGPLRYESDGVGIDFEDVLLSFTVTMDYASATDVWVALLNSIGDGGVNMAQLNFPAGPQGEMAQSINLNLATIPGRYYFQIGGTTGTEHLGVSSIIANAHFQSDLHPDVLLAWPNEP
jgi:hypothetical protein